MKWKSISAQQDYPGAALNKTEDKKLKVGKDVSAFAYSGGGTIIYGILEKDHKASAHLFIHGRTF